MDGQTMPFTRAVLPRKITAGLLAAFVLRDGAIKPVRLKGTLLPRDWIGTGQDVFERVKEGHVPGQPHLYRYCGTEEVLRCRAVNLTGDRCRHPAHRAQMCRRHANSAERGAPPALIADDAP